jgi:hypothetical protein
MTGDTTTWHADSELLSRYVAGTLRRVQMASVEAHLLTCASCRAAVAPRVEAERLARNLAAITDRVDQPHVHLIERALRRIGVPEHIARVLTVTPSARVAWFVAIAAALALAGVADLGGVNERAEFAFLVVAPLLPLVGMTAVFSTRGDPARELVLAAPTPGFEVLLIRSLAVLAPTIAVATVAAALVPAQGWEPVLWLLPSFGLAAATLALGSWIPVRWAAWALGGAWVTAAVFSVRGAPRADLIESFGAFRPVGQVVLVAVALVCGAVVVLRRATFDSAHPRRLT